MFQHIGALTLSPTATEADRAAIVSGLRGLPGQVPGLESARVVRDAGINDGNADLLFIMTFDSRESWEAYGSHPAHVAVVQERIAPVLSSKTFVQVDDPTNLA